MDPILVLDKNSSAVASAPAESMPEARVSPPNGLTTSSSNLLTVSVICLDVHMEASLTTYTTTL